MGADGDAFERAVVLAAAVVGALLHGAGDAVVGVGAVILRLINEKASF